MKIFVPDGTYACYVLTNNNTIRAYETQPHVNSSSNYTDFYINSHYLYTNGTQTWNQYSTLPVCLSTSNITTNVFYRNDISDIMITFFIILLVCFYFPYKIISRLFGRWFKI